MSAVLSSEDPLMPTRGTNLPTEIACYSLPYGGLGFASHLLTYYTIICLGFGRKPLWPFKRVKNGKYGLALAVIGLVGGFILSTITMVRCRNHWQLLVLAVWKFSMSLFNGIVAVHVAANHFWNARGRVESEARGREEKQSWLQNEDVNNPQPNLKVFLWFAIYVPGMIAGFVGLISLITENWSDGSPKLHTVVHVFAYPVGIGVFLILADICGWWQGACKGVAPKVLAVLLPGFLILSVVFGDWALGAMADNLAGVPTNDQALYYLYWISKRFTMFSW